MRRHDLDWLRVLVFGLLIFYHAGMFFVPWGFHIKNNVIYEWLVYPMLFVNQWRLPILFVISGMGTYYALNKRTGKQFAKERIIRLYIPLTIGMLLIVPPQVYIERLVNGQFVGTYLDYWPIQAFSGIYPEGNLSWHHLWFLPYLLLFSLLLIPVFLYLKKHPTNAFTKWVGSLANTAFGSFWFIIPLYLCEAFLEPFFNVTHALIDDWFNFISSMILFFYGFVLISVKEAFWKTVQANRRLYVCVGIVSFILLMLIIFGFEDSTLRHFTEALVKVFNIWVWILAWFGYASYYLNKPSKILSYANQAVYPFYILHQTFTLIVGYFIMDLPWGFLPKFSILIVGTFLGSWLLYELGIRRWKIIRPLFGLKIRKK
ncbi:MAG: acyltransferase family protein [Bacteroidota bacterium]